MVKVSCEIMCEGLDMCGLLDGSYDWGSSVAGCEQWCGNYFGGSPSMAFVKCAGPGFGDCDGDLIENCL